MLDGAELAAVLGIYNILISKYICWVFGYYSAFKLVTLLLFLILFISSIKTDKWKYHQKAKKLKNVTFKGHLLI